MTCQTTRTLNHKRGLSYTLTGGFKYDNGDPVPLADIDITSKIVDPDGNLVSTCTIEKQPDGYTYTASVADTSTWPLGILYTDAKITLPDGSSAATETLIIINSYNPS